MFCLTNKMIDDIIYNEELWRAAASGKGNSLVKRCEAVVVVYFYVYAVDVDKPDIFKIVACKSAVKRIIRLRADKDIARLVSRYDESVVKIAVSR